MGKTGIEFGAIVPAGVAHDAVVVAHRGRERIHARGRQLVGGVGLAELEGAEAPSDSEVAIARPERTEHLVVDVPLGSLVHRAGSRSRSHVDLGFHLKHHSVPTSDVVVAAKAEVRQVARDIRLPAHLAYRRRVLARSALLDAFRDVVDRQIEVTVKLHRRILCNCWRRRAESRRDDKRCRSGSKYFSPLHLRSFLKSQMKGLTFQSSADYIFTAERGATWEMYPLDVGLAPPAELPASASGRRNQHLTTTQVFFGAWRCRYVNVPSGNSIPS